ncbi:hypothetical protein ES708_30671 [subsurface metagenome]
MAKPKTPLLSMGARGSIGDTLTFQKRGRLTIARQKPIPTDPQTDLQLAQRQVYRDAVADWNALTPEEKEAWRGVCPGLTPYQCYMKSALVYVPPEPPPEEYTEEQTETQTDWGMRAGADTRAGQRLTIPNRKVIKLGFWLKKTNLPTGDVNLTIRKVSDDSLICSKVWGDAADLPTERTYKEKEFDTSILINEEVRISAEFIGGDAQNQVGVALKLSDVKPGECFTYYKSPDWTEGEGYDCAYRYKYYEV